MGCNGSSVMDGVRGPQAFEKNNQNLLIMSQQVEIMQGLNLEPVQQTQALLEKTRSPAEMLELKSQDCLHSWKNQENLPTFEDLVEGIRKELIENKHIYNNFLPIEHVLKILQELGKSFFDQLLTLRGISQIISYLSYCKNVYCQPQLQTTYDYKYAPILGLCWNHMNQTNQMSKKAKLKSLKFLEEEIQDQKRQYDICFQDLKMDLSEEMCTNLISVVSNMVQDNYKSFCYMSNYLYLSCLTLYNKGAPLQQVKQQYTTILHKIYNKYKISQVFGTNDHLDIYDSFRREDERPRFMINLIGEKQPQKVLDRLIMERVAESKSYFFQFYDILKGLIQDNKGHRFEAGLKISDESDKIGLMKLKQQILANANMETLLQDKIKIKYFQKYQEIDLRIFITYDLLQVQSTQVIHEYNHYKIKNHENQPI